jgi:uncharacterized protein involved in exopolysaccharide biosynthesis
MAKRVRTDHDLESLRRSLAMLQTNQLALTRDQGMDLITQLIDTRRRVGELDAQLAQLRRGSPQPSGAPDAG